MTQKRAKKSWAICRNSIVLFGLIYCYFCVISLQAQSFHGNFFLGEDKDKLPLVHEGFGSMNFSFTPSYMTAFWQEKPTHPILEIGLGWSQKRYRLAENLIFDNESGVLTFMSDTNSTHIYNNTAAFNFGKSRIISNYARLNINVGLLVKDLIVVNTGPVLDVLVYTRYKRTWLRNGIRRQEIVGRNGTFQFSPINIGWQAAIGLPGIVVYGIYFPTPFFQKDTPLKIRTAEAGIRLTIANF